MLGAVLAEVGEGASGLGAIDLHPTPADLDQVGPLLGRAAQHLLGHGGVVEYDLPVDESRGTEAASAGLGAGLHRAPGGRSAAGQPLGGDELHPGGLERFDGLEGGGGAVEVRGVGALGQPWGHLGHYLGDGIRRGAQQVVEQGQEARLTGQGVGGRCALDDVGHGAPAAAVVGVDQFEGEWPQ